MTARSYGAPLEQSCLRPGCWQIEGYIVERRGHTDGRARWFIAQPDARGAMRHIAVVGSLGAARDRVRRELERIAGLECLGGENCATHRS